MARLDLNSRSEPSGSYTSEKRSPWHSVGVGDYAQIIRVMRSANYVTPLSCQRMVRVILVRHCLVGVVIRYG